MTEADAAPATLDRRGFLRGLGLLAGAAPLLARAGGVVAPAVDDANAATLPDDGRAPLRWLPGHAPAAFAGVTWGTPWPPGRVAADAGFVLRDAGGATVPVQSWPLAYWPDGTLKWSAHALAPQVAVSSGYTLEPARKHGAPAGATRVTVCEHGDTVRVDTGALQATIPRSGDQLLREVRRAGMPALADGHLLLQIQNDPEADDIHVRDYRGQVERVEVEQSGSQRAVVAIRGRHVAVDGGARLPFVLRLYFYAGSAALRIVYTIVYDADENREFVKGLGLRFAAPLQGPLHDRHVRFAGADGGVFAEAVRGLTGLRRDPGEAIAQAQLDGRATPPLERFPPALAQRLDYVPAFGSYRLLQAHPDGFSIDKRTAAGQGWVHAASGARAAGTGWIGTSQGGVAFGVRNFWQSYPGQLDIEDAHTDAARVTLWLWAPQAAPMDLRFYHDGEGLEDFARQREALEITYEDYEPGFGSPLGVARTSELQLEFLAATPSHAQLLRIAERIAEPPQLVAAPQWLHAAGAFGPVWTPQPPRGALARELEAQLAWYFHFYRQEVEQRRWYGFWDYGDVMHSYDGYRHVWRYDVGGYAWDNSELSTDLWLWYYFLRTGRSDVFRMAEAMTRHTGEVDVHHLGRFAPLGSRHNVRHWGDSAKQLRISTAANRRFLYYLTADERTGELLREQVEALRTLQKVLPGRKIGQQAPADPGRASIYFGTDWGAIAAAWMTEWERTLDPAIGQRLRASMASIAAQPHGLFTGVAEMDLDSGVFARSDSDALWVSHLSAAFGLAETCAELLQALPEPAFERAWLDYCRLYNADAQAQRQALGRELGHLNLAQGHARLTAYAAWRLRDEDLRRRAWREFQAGDGGIAHPSRRLRRIAPPAVLNPVDEAEPVSGIDRASGSTGADNLSTNAVAQWSLAAMTLLALAGEPPEPDR
ncbi:MAG: Tat pathway signal sequence domain protein [Pseudomonas sp.]